MKGLTTLIKLHKRTLDELRRKMGALENQKSQLQLASARLQEELEREMKMAAKQPEMSNFFGGFAKRIKKRQDDIAGEIKAIEQRMAKLADEISEAYTELKKFRSRERVEARRCRAETQGHHRYGRNRRPAGRTQKKGAVDVGWPGKSESQ